MERKNKIMVFLVLGFLLFGIVTNVNAARDKCTLTVKIFSTSGHTLTYKVFINDVYKGEYYQRKFTDVEPGNVRVKVGLGGVYKEQTVTCNAGESKTVPFYIRTYTVHVYFYKYGSNKKVSGKIYLNGEYLGYDNHVYLHPIAGNGEYLLEVRANGYYPGELKVSSTRYTSVIRLKKMYDEEEYCTLKLASSMGWGRRYHFYVNDKYYGAISVKEFKVSPGTYTVRAERDGYVSETKTVECPAGEVGEAKFKLKEEGSETSQSGSLGTSGFNDLSFGSLGGSTGGLKLASGSKPKVISFSGFSSSKPKVISWTLKPSSGGLKLVGSSFAGRLNDKPVLVWKENPNKKKLIFTLA